MKELQRLSSNVEVLSKTLFDLARSDPVVHGFFKPLGSIPAQNRACHWADFTLSPSGAGTAFLDIDALPITPSHPEPEVFSSIPGAPRTVVMGNTGAQNTQVPVSSPAPRPSPGSLPCPSPYSLPLSSPCSPPNLSPRLPPCHSRRCARSSSLPRSQHHAVPRANQPRPQIKKRKRMDPSFAEAPDVPESSTTTASPQHDLPSHASPSISRRFRVKAWELLKLKMRELHEGLQELGFPSSEATLIINMMCGPLARAQGHELQISPGSSLVTLSPLSGITPRRPEFATTSAQPPAAASYGNSVAAEEDSSEEHMQLRSKRQRCA